MWALQTYIIYHNQHKPGYTIYFKRSHDFISNRGTIVKREQHTRTPRQSWGIPPKVPPKNPPPPFKDRLQSDPKTFSTHSGIFSYPEHAAYCRCLNTKLQLFVGGRGEKNHSEASPQKHTHTHMYVSRLCVCV